MGMGLIVNRGSSEEKKKYVKRETEEVRKMTRERKQHKEEREMPRGDSRSSRHRGVRVLRDETRLKRKISTPRRHGTGERE